MAKKNGHIWRTNQNIPDIMHQIGLSCPNKNKIPDFRQFVVHADMTTTKRGTFLEKTPQAILSWWNHFWSTIAKFSVTLRTRKLQNKNLTQIWKKLTNTAKRKRSVSIFFRLYLNNNWGHRPRLLCFSPSVQFFSSLRRPEKLFWHQQGQQRPRFLIGSTNVIIQKTTTAVNRVEHQKTVNLKIKHGTPIVVFRNNQRTISSTLANFLGKRKKRN